VPITGRTQFLSSPTARWDHLSYLQQLQHGLERRDLQSVLDLDYQPLAPRPPWNPEQETSLADEHLGVKRIQGVLDRVVDAAGLEHDI